MGLKPRTRLKPCPFCGGRAIVTEPILWGRYTVGCSAINAACPAGAPFAESPSRADAIKRWNTRNG